MQPEPRSEPSQPDDAVVTGRLLDLFIRAGLIAVLAALCYVVFAPFLTLMVWALVLATVLYPLHVWLARRVGGRGGLAATLVVMVGIVGLIVPTALLMNSFGGTVHGLVDAVQRNTLQIP